MLRIAILDDEATCISRMESIIRQHATEVEMEYKIRSYATSGAFLDDLREKDYYDLYLLDMELPDTNGLEIARQIRKEFIEPVIIYVTNHVEYAVQAFEVASFRYIPKMLLEEKLPEALSAFLARQQKEYTKAYVIKNDSETRRIPYCDIYYVKKDGKNVIIHHRLGECKVRTSIQKIAEELHSRRFLVIDRAYIVNMKYVMALNKQEIQIKDGLKLPVSRTRLQYVKREIAAYFTQMGGQ